MRNSKKVTAPQVVKTTVALRVKQATGGAKEQSFYQQRDRLALFYSSLKAETLAVEITREFRKLRKSPDAWGRYYGQWRKRVRSSLARDIREFPKSSETYAYPKVLANFKKDYDKIYTFGETFDARAKGTRLPSGAPTDIKSVFSQYKKQAQELNR